MDGDSAIVIGAVNIIGVLSDPVPIYKIYCMLAPERHILNCMFRVSLNLCLSREFVCYAINVMSFVRCFMLPDGTRYYLLISVSLNSLFEKSIVRRAQQEPAFRY